MSEARLSGGLSDYSRASVRHRLHPWLEFGCSVLIGISAFVAGIGFSLLLIGGWLLLDWQ